MNGVTEAVKLEDVEVTITYMNFLEAGWTCAELSGVPAYLHPIVIQVFGCSTTIIHEGHVIQCDVILGVGWDWIKQHELNHCKGYDD